MKCLRQIREGTVFLFWCIVFLFMFPSWKNEYNRKEKMKRKPLSPPSSHDDVDITEALFGAERRNEKVRLQCLYCGEEIEGLLDGEAFCSESCGRRYKAFAKRAKAPFYERPPPRDTGHRRD